MADINTNLGVIITSPLARKIIYGAYVVAIVIAGAISVGFASIQVDQPAWLTATVAVLAYLGIPVGGLAAANTSTSPVAPVADVPVGDADDGDHDVEVEEPTTN